MYIFRLSFIDMFEGLSEEEIKVFMSVFQKVYDNAERMISNEKNA